MRLAALAISLFAPFAVVAQSAGNPYVLKIDRAAYRLGFTGEEPSASAGGSVPEARPTTPPASSGASLQRHARIAELQLRERQYEQRMRELARERDAWRQHARELEAQLLLERRSFPALALPPPPAY